MDYALGHSVRNDMQMRYFQSTMGNCNYNLVNEVKKCWSQPGDDTRYARFTANDTDWGNRNYGRTSDIFVEKADYLCLRDVSLSWSLPKAWLRKLHISDVTLTVSGNTLCYWDGPCTGSRPRPRPPAASTPRRRPTTPGSVPTRRRAKCSSRPNSRSDTLLP